MTFKTEADMFEPLRQFFLEHRYTVYSEVVLPGGGRADIVAVDGKYPVCIEMKKSLTLDLIEQVIERKAYFPYVLIAIPDRRTPIHKFIRRIFKEHGIGILYVNPKTESVRLVERSFYRRPYKKLKGRQLLEYLKPEQIDGLPGGTRGGGYVTDYSTTIAGVRRFLRSHRGKWVSFDLVLDRCTTHYASPRSGLRQALMTFEKGWCESRVVDRRLQFRHKEESIRERF